MPPAPAQPALEGYASASTPAPTHGHNSHAASQSAVGFAGTPNQGPYGYHASTSASTHGHYSHAASQSAVGFAGTPNQGPYGHHQPSPFGQHNSMPGQPAAFPHYHGPLTVMPAQTTVTCSFRNTQAANTEGNQTRLNLIFKIVEDPAEVCRELLAHCGKPKAHKIRNEVELHQQFLDAVAQQNDEYIARGAAEMKRIEADLKRVKSSNRKIVTVSQTLQNDVIPFLYQFAGISDSDVISFPKDKPIGLVEPWILSRIKDVPSMVS